MPDEQQTSTSVAVVDAPTVEGADPDVAAAETGGETSAVVSLEDIARLIDEGNQQLEDELQQLVPKPEDTAKALQGTMTDSLEANNVKLAKVLLDQMQQRDEEQAKAEKSGEEQAVMVQLEKTQYDYLHDSLQVQSSCAVLALLMLAVLAGATCVQYLIGGANRG